MIDIKKGSLILAISENGFAKRTDPEEYRVTNRGGKGVVNMKVNEKTGNVIFVDAVLPDYDVIISTKEGQMIRIDLDSIRETGRSAQGVKAISLSEGDYARDAAALPSLEDPAPDISKIPLAGTQNENEPVHDEPKNDDDI
jgi:DNA gyrase subunit A